MNAALPANPHSGCTCDQSLLRCNSALCNKVSEMESIPRSFERSFLQVFEWLGQIVEAFRERLKELSLS